MTRTSPQVSVVIPAYNAETTLRETLQSVTGGSYRELEIIVVDDGSTDGTLAVAQEVSRQDPRVRIEQRKNGGLSAALNSGFALARGKYVARLDADDLWHPSKLQYQLDLARRHPDIAFIYTFARYIDEDGRVLHDGPRQIFPRWALCRGLYESVVGGGSSALIKRSAIEEAEGCDEGFRNWEDLSLQLAISSRHQVGVVPFYLVGYRVRPGSLSKDVDTMLCGWRAVRAKFIREFSQIPGFVHAWAHGVRCGMFAEGYAWRRRYLRSATLLLEALNHDPSWVWALLRFRLARRANKRSSIIERAAVAPNFFDCDPAKQVTVDAFARHPASLRFTGFENDRIRILSELDERLARQRTSTDR